MVRQDARQGLSMLDVISLFPVAGYFKSSGVITLHGVGNESVLPVVSLAPLCTCLRFAAMLSPSSAILKVMIGCAARAPLVLIGSVNADIYGGGGAAPDRGRNHRCKNRPNFSRRQGRQPSGECRSSSLSHLLRSGWTG